MSAPKDSPEAMKFMSLYQKLRDMIDDDPSDLVKISQTDTPLKKLCVELNSVGYKIKASEKRHRRMFSHPVDPKFVSAWRDYEKRYEDLVQTAAFFGSAFEGIDPNDPKDVQANQEWQWKVAEWRAEELESVIETALTFAFDQITQEKREFDEEFRNKVERGVVAWDELKVVSGLDIRGIARRRAMVPFILIPRHVSDKHGQTEKLSLFTHLQQAHDAYVLGVHFAALALMRAILETTLREHYGAVGADLNELIKTCRGLPRSLGGALHRLRLLANDILHSNKDTIRLPDDFEREIVRGLNALRELIEGAPTGRVR